MFGNEEIKRRLAELAVKLGDSGVTEAEKQRLLDQFQKATGSTRDRVFDAMEAHFSETEIQIRSRVAKSGSDDLERLVIDLDRKK